MKHTFKFKGRDGSLGYKNGELYNLTVIFSGTPITIVRDDGTGTCVYSNIVKFMENWDLA